ncbi:MAG: GGDEF domain-containing protein, partial [Lachnospiraceae bacterium]|nr:GGDEF domain-containing protein [Lachnospiraceae bacterium]
MQKTFIKYAVMIITSAIFLILFINFLFSRRTLEIQQFNTFHAKIEQVIHTLESNRMELELVRKNLDEDYLIRAKAATYVMDRQAEVVTDVSMMQYLAELLNVDELHVIDENGIIVSSSVHQYVGFDMAIHEQTKPFLDLLESDDEEAYLIQEPQPNAAEGNIMQYVGVPRRAQKGVVQVGFVPERQLEAQSRNTYDYIFSRFPTDVEEELFVVDLATGEVLGHSDNIEQGFAEDCYQMDQLLDCTEGAFKLGKDGERMYI